MTENRYIFSQKAPSLIFEMVFDILSSNLYEEWTSIRHLEALELIPFFSKITDRKTVENWSSLQCLLIGWHEVQPVKSRNFKFALWLCVEEMGHSLLLVFLYMLNQADQVQKLSELIAYWDSMICFFYLRFCRMVVSIKQCYLMY